MAGDRKAGKAFWPLVWGRGHGKAGAYGESGFLVAGHCHAVFLPFRYGRENGEEACLPPCRLPCAHPSLDGDQPFLFLVPLLSLPAISGADYGVLGGKEGEKGQILPLGLRRGVGYFIHFVLSGDFWFAGSWGLRGKMVGVAADMAVCFVSFLYKI